MTGHTKPGCYFCTDGELALEVIEASLHQSIADGGNAPRLQRRLRALQHTLSAHHCAGG